MRIKFGRSEPSSVCGAPSPAGASDSPEGALSPHETAKRLSVRTNRLEIGEVMNVEDEFTAGR